ncbi:MAG: MqnA/MqnD/SBP family protein [Gammaproteobacteria bacterium]
MSNARVLTIGTTPCPNDSFLLGAVACGRVGLEGMDVDLELADIETLNEQVLGRRAAVAKISCAIYQDVADDYVLLDTGAALAHAHGPVVLAREPLESAALARARVAAPGRHTTAALLFRQWATTAREFIWLPYHRIIDALLAGQCEVGVCIHESRFTFADAGLHCLVDLGEWWQACRGLPVPLGCYVMHRALDPRHRHAVEDLMLRSLAWAARGDVAIVDYIRTHAQELDDDVIRRHIELYVNRYTYSLGARGHAAIAALADRARASTALAP